MPPTNNPPISDPTIMGRLNETLGYIGTLERHCADMDGSIFGKGQQSGLEPQSAPTTLEGMMTNACERAASLCGWLAAIKNRVGCIDSFEPASLPVPQPHARLNR